MDAFKFTDANIFLNSEDNSWYSDERIILNSCNLSVVSSISSAAVLILNGASLVSVSSSIASSGVLILNGGATDISSVAVLGSTAALLLYGDSNIVGSSVLSTGSVLILYGAAGVSNVIVLSISGGIYYPLTGELYILASIQQRYSLESVSPVYHSSVSPTERYNLERV